VQGIPIGTPSRPSPPTTPGLAVAASKPNRPPTDPGFAVPPVKKTTDPALRKYRPPTDPGIAVPTAVAKETTSVGWAAVPAATSPRKYERPPTDPGVLHVRGTPDVDDFTAELTTRLAAGTVDALTIDLDGAELLGDELAPVLRRASAAARSAGVELVVRATRTGPKRWLARHGLDGLGDDA
jgi:anti-anti-sigma regulatory factor